MIMLYYYIIPLLLYSHSSTGHGFKLSPVFGKLLSQLVMKKTPSHDLHPFRLSRFLSTFMSKL